MLYDNYHSEIAHELIFFIRDIDDCIRIGFNFG